jgi:release factor glutamine methyltransferase
MPPAELADAAVNAWRAAATERLRASGVQDPVREVRLILEGVAEVSTTDLLLRPPRVDDATRGRLDAAVARRAAGEPLAYVLGAAAFRDLQLGVDDRVLIPRPETEGLVERVLQWARARWGAGRWGAAVDVGTGSGCIALSLAAEGAFAAVTAIEFTAGAVAVARSNARRLDRRGRVWWVRGDLLCAVRPGSVDVVVSNPPYIATDEMGGLDRSVREFEPASALDSGADGLAHTRALLTDARAVLAPGGLLAVEIDARRANASRAAAGAAGWRDVAVEEDLFGRPRYLLTTRE